MPRPDAITNPKLEAAILSEWQRRIRIAQELINKSKQIDSAIHEKIVANAVILAQSCLGSRYTFASDPPPGEEIYDTLMGYFTESVCEEVPTTAIGYTRNFGREKLDLVDYHHPGKLEPFEVVFLMRAYRLVDGNPATLKRISADYGFYTQDMQKGLYRLPLCQRLAAEGIVVAAQPTT